MTTTGRVLTVLVLSFAVLNVTVGALTDAPWLAVGMLAFLLVCQVGVAWVESYESARAECDSVTAVLAARQRFDLSGSVPTSVFRVVSGRESK